MTWDSLKAGVIFIIFVLVLIGVGQFGWAIILGFISLIIFVVAYLVIRIITEYPKDND